MAEGRAGRRAGQIVLALVAVVVVGLLVRPPPPAQPVPTPTATPAVSPEPTATATPTPPDPVLEHVAAVPGTWTPLPTAPLDPVRPSVGIWTGRELLVGFAEEVAAFDPAAGTWREIPVPEDLRRGNPHLEWTGSEVLVHGGWELVDGQLVGRPDTTALDPTTGGWRRFDPAPSPPASGTEAVVWTGEELVVWGQGPGPATSDADPLPPVGAALDPATGTWRTLPAAPVERVGWARGAWFRDEVVLVGQHLPDGRASDGAAYAVAYDPAADTWRTLPPPPVVGDAHVVEIAPNGTPHPHLVIVGEESSRLGRDEVRGARLGPIGDRWLPTTPVLGPGAEELTMLGLSATPTDQHLVVHGGYPTSFALLYTPTVDHWRRIEVQVPRVAAVTAWTGEELLLWGGLGREGPTVELWSWRPDDRALARWRE